MTAKLSDFGVIYDATKLTPWDYWSELEFFDHNFGDNPEPIPDEALEDFYSLMLQLESLVHSPTD